MGEGGYSSRDRARVILLVPTPLMTNLPSQIQLSNGARKDRKTELPIDIIVNLTAPERQGEARACPKSGIRPRSEKVKREGTGTRTHSGGLSVTAFWKSSAQ